jgi:citrate synthase
VSSHNALETSIASHDLHHIWVRGVDLTEELMGKRRFSETAFLLIAGRFPDENEARLVDAILISLMEHGLTLSAVTARATFWAAPESFQGAVAAGLLGAGSKVLGSMEECGSLLTRLSEPAEGGLNERAAGLVAEYASAKKRLPGLGHAIHKEGDPRAARLFALAGECGRRGTYVQTLETLRCAAESSAGRPLPINATGAIAAILLELGIPWQLHRGFALISRAVGLVAHIAEELEAPITPGLREVLFEAGKGA